ncbi:MAG: pilus assembly protein N-terminal domain-containing protein, partial [Cyanobacteria bacterium NC_groundwater_1444_Ag_S-0.65um_54_12]|nr:pilus assembly protein N-terminal domain-containing protein [Cyanobacteria bacterium NC_groundwater_1444_Ag_S-0.65um_54_12]
MRVAIVIYLFAVNLLGVIPAGGAPAKELAAPLTSLAVTGQAAGTFTGSATAAIAADPRKHPARIVGNASPSSDLSLFAPGTRVSADETILLDVGKSLVLNLPTDITRVSIAEPAIADVALLSRREVLVNGKHPGTTSFIVWTQNTCKPYDISVQLDTRLLKKTIVAATGARELKAEYFNDAIVLSGQVAKPSQIEMAGKIAGSFAAKIVNLLKSDTTPQVEVAVHVIEALRSSGHDLGIKFGSVHTTPNGETQFNPDLLTFGETAGPPYGGSNLLTFGQLDRIAVQLKLLVSSGRARVLADPKLVAVSGGKATFLVGGEVPVPEAQQYGNVTIAWREYGVRLAVEPRVLEDGRVDLKVEPEVSTLDFANGVRIGQL